MEMELIGYEIFTAGNISGRFDRDSETRVISPHSWFFVRRGIPASSVLPPAFELCEAAATATAPPAFDMLGEGGAEEGGGLPSYDEAMEQAELDLYKEGSR